MSTVSAHTIDGDITVGELVEESPAALMKLLTYQTGASGLCVIAGDDTLGDLSDRFNVPMQRMLQDLDASRRSD